MSKHSTADEGSRTLCEALSRELAFLQPGIARIEKPTSCGFSNAPNSQFAYVVSHGRKSPKLEIYFRCPAEFARTNVSTSIPISRRDRISTAWGKAFPAHFSLSDQNDVTDAARFLIDVAYPFSIKRKLRSGRGPVSLVERPPESIPEEVLPTTTYREGAIVPIVVNRYERNPEARAACIAFYGARCCVCCFSFGEFYGDSMEGFIHVHHLQPLATLGGDYEIDPVKDLRPLCPNCHAVVHRIEPPMTLEQVTDLVRRRA